MRFRLLSAALALAACALIVLAVTASAATPRELADEYCFHTNAMWCIDKDGDGTRESAPQLHPRFTEEGIEHLREHGRYFDPNDVDEPDPTPTPTPTPVPIAAPTAAPTAGLNYAASQSAALTEDKSKRTRDKATITIAGSWTSAWYYQADTGAHANSCTAVDAGTHTVNLTGLGAGTRFTYTAYRDGNCTVALGSVTFTTAVVAGNATLGQNQTGRAVRPDRQIANSFTTGAHSAGYDLKQVIGRFHQHFGDPDPVSVAIHEASGGSPGNRLWILRNFNGDPRHTFIGAQKFHFRCLSAACTLQSGTTYFVVVSIPNSTKLPGSNYYDWQRTTEDGEELTPANNGWSLGNVLLESADGSNWANNANGWAARFDVVAFPQ